MTKITQKQLIESLKQMKEIKPRQEWVSLLKSQILAEKKVELEDLIPQRQAKSVGFINTFSSVFSQRKLAYSFAAILLLIVGAFGFVKLLPSTEVNTQIASLTQQTPLIQNVVAFNSNINDLATAAKDGKTNNMPSAISKVGANASQLAKSLKANPTQDPQTIKELASSLKTLADVPGTDLSQNTDVQDLYQTIVQSQITDLQKTTLTSDQQTTLKQAEDLYDQEKYEQALEAIWTITNNINSGIAGSASTIDTTNPTK